MLQDRQSQQQPAYAGPVTEYAGPQQDRGYSSRQEGSGGGYQGPYEGSYSPPEDPPRSYAEYWPVEDPADGDAPNVLLWGSPLVALLQDKASQNIQVSGQADVGKVWTPPAVLETRCEDFSTHEVWSS